MTTTWSGFRVIELLFRVYVRVNIGLAMSYSEQLYSSPSDRERKTNKKICNKHQNTVDIQDYQAVTCV